MNGQALIAVAPNGARKLKADHAAVPLTAHELGLCAAACADAGAAMIHLHVRNQDGGHSLDADLYRDAVSAVRREAGTGIIIQCTSEAAGVYDRHGQMAAMRALLPEACSLAIREILPDAASESEGAGFLAELRKAEVSMQFILYSAEDLLRFRDLVQRGVIPGERHFVLFVLGRYAKDQQSTPSDLLPFLQAWQPAWGAFAVCAFGKLEAACALSAIGLGGHARIGFENNILLADGSIAPDNAALVHQIADHAAVMGAAAMTPDAARGWLRQFG
ncbi:3-keto-5-aminohexanoate cleavage protein [Ferrovibrio sp.]|uniref:3-keto-5-aminohexanoate cleavage protein n=1 Tax=Ferrovibrio sp. TaxID=1917215 RepID=UPI0035B40EBF